MLRFCFVWFTMIVTLSGIPKSHVRADEETDKELKKIEGIWKSTPREKGRDRVNIFAIQGGYIIWRSFQTLDGKPLAGHDKFFKIELDTKEKPKRFIATQEGGFRPLKLKAIYERDGDKLKIAFGEKDEFPKKFDDDISLYELTLDKEAEVPDIAKLVIPKKAITVKSEIKWSGSGKKEKISELSAELPITTEAEFIKNWKLARGAEAIPKIDFTKEFVVICTAIKGRVTAIELRFFEGEKRAEMTCFVDDPADPKSENWGYMICTFKRDIVDVVDGKIVPKPAKK